jgi:homoserine dehydrogenase
MRAKIIKVGLLGLGTVGGGVAQLLVQEKSRLSNYLGAELVLSKAVDLRPELAQGLGLGDGVFTSDAQAVLADPDIDIVVEMIGGLDPARGFILEAISQGKQVATANKALLASHGVEIFEAARKQKGGVAFEASVGGGIPLVRSLRDSLAANRINSCLGILNGTCNFILSRMTAQSEAFDQVLAEAQTKGYAEADPFMDVEGHDTAHKLAIVAALVTGCQPRLEDIPTEGISKITPLDIELAGEFGFKVKLLAILNNTGDVVEARVHPALVADDHLLASVQGPFNALHIDGDWVGQVLLHGRGAGREPTASAVVGDVLDLARDIISGCPGRVPPLGTASQDSRMLQLASLDDTVCRYYFRFTAQDRPGVLAHISRVLGDNGISIQAVIQKGRRDTGPVPIVMLTHQAREAAVKLALNTIDSLDMIAEPTMLIRVA